MGRLSIKLYTIIYYIKNHWTQGGAPSMSYTVDCEHWKIHVFHSISLLVSGLTLLVPYLLTRRKRWHRSKVRVFIVGDEQNMEEGRNE